MQKFILQFIYCFLLRIFLKVIVGVRFDVARFLLQEKQFIIVANHNSHLDTMVLMSCIPRKFIHRVKPVAAGDYFGKTKLKASLTNYFINALLIDRKRHKDDPEKDPIQKILHTLDEGYSLILFPEGTRGEPEKIQPLKAGIGLILSQRPHIKYVPAFLSGMGKAMPKGDNLILPFNSSLTLGRPTYAETTEVNKIIAQIEQDLLALKNATST